MDSYARPSKSPIWQLFILLLSACAGSVLFSTPVMFLYTYIYKGAFVLEAHPDAMRLMQFTSAIGTFLIPALATTWLSGMNWRAYLHIRRLPSLRILAWVFLSMVLLIPAINVTMLWNESMRLPEWAAPIEAWMKTQEETMQHLTEVFLFGGGFCPLLSNLIVIALTAAVTEEFLFRGALQRIFTQWSGRTHLAIWLTAFLFSAIHLQFYGFIPRMLLGAYFGYLLVWSRNIWIPVAAHFFNNAITVLLSSDKSLQEQEWASGEITDAHLIPYVGLAFVCFIAFLFVTRIIQQSVSNFQGKD